MPTQPAPASPTPDGANAPTEPRELGRPDFAERREARAERLANRAQKLASESAAAYQRTRAIASMIPFGQPILVGHHSEGRARRDAARIHDGMRKSVELSKAADETARRAEAAENNTAIDSDDPEVLVKLREKLARLEVEQAKLASYRKALRGPNAEQKLLDLGMPQLLADDVARNGIASYVGSNLSGRIRQVKTRIAQLEAAASRPVPAAETIGGVTISESLNRVQMHFPGKPSEEVRKQLKSNGFRWAPSEGAWQRKASSWAWTIARQIAGAL